MDFEEKIDAMRTTLELAIHDIEGQRASIQELRMLSQEMRLLSASQYENIQALMKISSELVQTAQSHERRISGMEGRI